ncbi:MAG: C40 family peptidase [Actinobacteria bacterium]|nr:C40 family peptidase [Actinomycetota bacterium]
MSALTLAMLPGASQAAPTTTATPQTSAQAAEQVQKLAQQLDAMNEQTLYAKVTLDKAKAKASAAQRNAQKIDSQYEAMVGQVRKMVAGVYMSAPFGEFAAFLSSDSPQNFLDQLSALDRVSAQRSTMIAKVGEAKSGLDRAKADAEAAVRAAQAKATDLNTQMAALKQQQATWTTLYNRLSAQERARMGGVNAAIDPGNLPPANSAAAQTAVNAAKVIANADPPHMYVWGGAGPDVYDCSGLTMVVWGKAGVSLPHSSREQYTYGTHVDRSNLAPGDLLFFYSPISHVAIYVGNGVMIEAPTSGQPVKYAAVRWGSYVGATRVG